MLTAISDISADETDVAQWKTSVPAPVFEREPGYIDLYWKAWELAHDHIDHQPGLPQTPYMDEAHWRDTIWIWDTCFMVLFCKYSPNTFPGVESLNNFYVPLHDKSYTPGTFPLNIQHPDNPPLFAWAEHDNFTFTGDRDHAINLLTKSKYLQRHYQWFDSVRKGWRFPSNAAERKLSAPVLVSKMKDGYLWGGVQSGMDNTPRQGGLWVDAIAQQALSALYIARMAERIGQDEMAKNWRTNYESLKDTINRVYWHDEDGIYYDVDPKTRKHLKVKTPASYWPMLAEVCTKEQAEKMVKHIVDPDTFGGDRPWVTVARTHPAFTKPDGNYWCGGIWLPTAYMGTKALEKYGYFKEADAAAEQLLAHMYRTYTTYKPQTIWECYSPTRDAPANHGRGLVRPDFCGWSALGPISLFIENVLGFHTIDAMEGVVAWRLYQTCRHGIQRLRFGGTTTDIIYEGGTTVTVTSDRPYELIINGASHKITAGKTIIEDITPVK